jgi:hypothetical protein
MASRSAPVAFTDVDIEELLGELNRTNRRRRGLADWAERSNLEVARLIEGADLSYVRLACPDETGADVVLMLLDSVWSRAI